MAKKTELGAASQIEKERSQFTILLAQNPNYFGNLTENAPKAVAKMIGNTKYEQLTCVGFNPASRLLEATIAIKLPFGYGGDLCQAGTTEYVRFFINYGAGWEDAGLSAVNVHDIPTDKDCAGVADKPLTYVATLKLDPKTKCCTRPVLPQVHAILSWQSIPPAGAANVGWMPPWGNTLDCSVQIKPRDWNILCLIDLLNEGGIQKLKVPPLLEEVQLHPIPLPDPPPLKVADLAKVYAAGAGKQGATEKSATSVEPHRFGVGDLHAIIGSGFNQELAIAKAAEWKAAGLDWASAVAALAETNANISYEQIECLGLDDNLERLVATFRIKRPTGYSGELCYPGSTEYVAFWADWDDTCKYTYLGTVQVNVHDFPKIPKEGLCYSAILPVDLTYHRRNCAKPKIGRVRAVLSWSVPPSTTDPDALNYWGNRLDTHVQINPGDPLNPGEVKPILWRVGGIRVENISIFSGLTIAAATFEGGFSPELGSPFADLVVIKGPSFPGYLYRVQVRNLTAGGVFTTLGDAMTIEPLFGPAYLKSPVTADGFFTYETLFNNPDMILARWGTAGNDKWEIKLEIMGQPGIATSVVQLKNSGIEDARIHIDPATGGDCGRFAVGDMIKGAFVARDPYLSGYSLGTLPFGTPPGVLTPTGGTVQTPPAGPDPAPPPGGLSWSLDTTGMKPCGYVLQLSVVDKAIRNSVPFLHHWATPSVGFCLLDKK